MTAARVTIADVQRQVRAGRKLVMLTAYDYPLARLADRAGADIVLVGDSLAMVVLGHATTRAVGMAEMLHHAKAARRGVERALLIGDMPYGSFQRGVRAAVRNARRFVDEAGCDGVKIEWAPGIERAAAAIVRTGIPVMGHVGLTPQTAASFTVQGKDAASAQRIAQSAVALERAGCFAVVLECIPAPLAALITRRLKVPTIGIGAGPDCDGQVLVTYDLIGLFDRFTPKFVKRYADVSTTITQALARFGRDVRAGRFPSSAQSFFMTAEALEKLVHSPQTTVHSRRRCSSVDRGPSTAD